MIEEALKVYQEQQMPLNLAAVMRDYLAQYPRARHFDVARLVVDQQCASVWLKQISQGCRRNGRQSMITEPRSSPCHRQILNK